MTTKHEAQRSTKHSEARSTAKHEAQRSTKHSEARSTAKHEAQRSTLVLLAGLCAIIGCSDKQLEETSGLAAQSDQLTQCDGLATNAELRLEELEITLRGTVCWAADGFPRTSWEGTDGSPVDLEKLRKADAHLFAQYHSRIARPLRAKPRARVDIWYRLEDESSRTKEELLADPLLDSELETARLKHVSQGRGKLLEMMAHVLSTAEMKQATFDPSVPRVEVEADLEALRVLGQDDHIVAIVPSANQEAREEQLQTENYIPVDVITPWANANLDGSGITVALLEGGRPDYWGNLSGAVAGSCSGFKCACPSGSSGSHSRWVMGVIRNSATTWNGVADDVTTLSANWAGSGSCSMSASAAWAFSNGASIINRSACGAAGSPQTGTDRYLDYLATVSPYPSIVGVTGNGGWSVRSCMNLRNGVVVGGADDNASPMRNAATMYTGTQRVNYAGAYGWEVPHVVAPARNIDTSGASLGAVVAATGTSFAAPQVSGAIAIAQEVNTSLKWWPEVILPALLVGADEGVDENLGGVWPMNLSDSIDDWDGAGLFNAFNSVAILSTSSKKNGNNSPSPSGHDYGTMSLAGAPFYYAETYYASVPAGTRLRSAALLQSRPVCGSPADETNCTGNAYPFFYLTIFNSSGVAVATSANGNQNYQYATVLNQTGTTQTYTMRIWLANPSGISSTTFGVAWLAT